MHMTNCKSLCHPKRFLSLNAFLFHLTTFVICVYVYMCAENLQKILRCTPAEISYPLYTDNNSEIYHVHENATTATGNAMAHHAQSTWHLVLLSSGNCIFSGEAVLHTARSTLSIVLFAPRVICFSKDR